MEYNRENLGEYAVQYPDITSISDFMDKRTVRTLNMNTARYNRYIRGRVFPNSRLLFRNSLGVPRPRVVVRESTVYQNNVSEDEDQNNVSEDEDDSTEFEVIATSNKMIFVCSVLVLGYVYISFPHLESEEKQHIKMPWEIEDAKALGRVLARYKERYYFQVLSAIGVTYMFLQTFAIPGSISLSVLSGFLFQFPVALFLVCFCSATGASLCYAISHFAGKKMINKYFPDRARRYSALVNKHQSNIFNYMLFLRITQFLPNWFINIAAPVVGVPILPFWLGTFLGVAPHSFVAIQTGQTLLQLTSTSGTWSWTSVVLLTASAILSLVPVFLKNTTIEFLC